MLDLLLSTHRLPFTGIVLFSIFGYVVKNNDVRNVVFMQALIVLELLQSKTSERQGRAIDTDSRSSMEIKKIDGYF